MVEMLLEEEGLKAIVPRGYDTQRSVCTVCETHCVRMNEIKSEIAKKRRLLAVAERAVAKAGGETRAG